MKTKAITMAMLALLVGSLFAVPALAASNKASLTEPADLSRDGYVDEQDLRLLMKHWGSCKSSKASKELETTKGCFGDLDGDKKVGLKDLLILLRSWSPRPDSKLAKENSAVAKSSALADKAKDYRTTANDGSLGKPKTEVSYPSDSDFKNHGSEVKAAGIGSVISSVRSTLNKESKLATSTSALASTTAAR